jgi:hypothetical protein
VGTFRQDTVGNVAEISYQYGVPIAAISGLPNGVHTFSGDVSYRWTLLVRLLYIHNYMDLLTIPYNTLSLII